MKRIGFIYDKLLDKNKIRQAFYDVAKGKTKRHSIQNYENNLDKNVDFIYNKLKNKEYVFKRGNKKIFKEYGKERLITVPKFRDQVVQRLFLNEISPMLLKSMYKFSCGSIPGRGGLYAKKYLEPKIRKKRYRYALKLDIKKYFHNIDINILLEQLKHKVKDRHLIDLIYNLLVAGANENGRGLPIGFYSSQWFSNFYLNGLDNYIKQDLKVKVYARYVDDMIILGNNKRELHKIKLKIEKYLTMFLKLELNNKWQVYNLRDKGVDFVGFRMFYNKTLLRKRTLKLLKRNKRIIRSGYINVYRSRVFLNYVAWLKHIKSRLIRFYDKEIKLAQRYVSYYDKRRLNHDT